MRILLTAGPTHEPIDAVRFLGNRSSGKMGAALAQTARNQNCDVTLILGPASIEISSNVQVIQIETAQEMHDAVLREFPKNDLLVMAAAVADYRPKSSSAGKLTRGGDLTLELESTPDIVAAAGHIKRPDQRTVGFSLESPGEIARARKKLIDKKLDLIVFNPLSTLASETIDATLIYPSGKEEKLPSLSKAKFADILVRRSLALFGK